MPVVASASIAGLNNSPLGNLRDVRLEEVGEEDSDADPPANWTERHVTRPKAPDHSKAPNLSLTSSKANRQPSPKIDRSRLGSPREDSISEGLGDDEVSREKRPKKPESGSRRGSFEKALKQANPTAQLDVAALKSLLTEQRRDFDIFMKKGSERVLHFFEDIVSENARLNCLLVAAGVSAQSCQGHTAQHLHNSDFDDVFDSKKASAMSHTSVNSALVHVQPRQRLHSVDETTELTPILPLDPQDSYQVVPFNQEHDDEGRKLFCARDTETSLDLDEEAYDIITDLVQSQSNRSLGRFSSFDVGRTSELCENSAAAEAYQPSGGFNLLNVWQEMRVHNRSIQRGKMKQPTVMLGMASRLVEEDESDKKHEDMPEGIRSRCIIHPNSKWRSIWDLVSLAMVVYDMGAIPFELFNPPDSTFRTSMMWIARIFWTLDMPLALISGYVKSDGTMELRLVGIIRHYLRTWFALDVIIVGVDWLELVLQKTSVLGVAKVGKASRVIRIIRMIRLLRLVRMKEVFSMFTERITSEKVIIVMDICRLMLLILGIAHFFACLWYGVGDSDDSQTWIRVHGYHYVSLSEAYLMCLHWSLSQFAGGMDEITPKNGSERLFTVVVFVFAFIMASVFVSSLTSSMTQLKQMSSHQAQQLSILRRYLRQHRISSKLGLRVQRSAVSALEERQRFMPEENVQLLRLVSEPLCVAIDTQIYTPLLSVHPFFKAYVTHVPQVMRKVCHSATSFMMVSCGDVIFSAGESPPHPKMYFVVHGSLTYHPFDGFTSSMHELTNGDWVAEATLWTEWIHHGLLKAKTECRLCVLEAKKFQNIVIQFEHSDFNPKSYASEFIRNLNEGEDVNDLPANVYDIQREKSFTGTKTIMERVAGGFPFRSSARVDPAVRPSAMRDSKQGPTSSESSSVGGDSKFTPSQSNPQMLHAPSQTSNLEVSGQPIVRTTLVIPSPQQPSPMAKVKTSIMEGVNSVTKRGVRFVSSA